MSGPVALVVIGVGAGLSYAWGGLFVLLVLDSRCADCISRVTRDRGDLGMLAVIAWPLFALLGLAGHALRAWKAARRGIPRPVRG